MRASPVPRARRASPPTAGGPRRTKTADVPNKRGNERKLTVSVAGVQQDVPQQATSKGNPGTGARLGDPEFRDYVRARRRSLLRTAYLLTGNLADAEDLVQSALAKTYVAWDRIEDRGALDGYVRRAIVNTHISSWRRRRLEEFPTDELPDQVVADHSVRSDLQEALRVAVDRLPERMRAAIQLRFYQDMTEAEVAQVLGVSLGTVKSTVARAVAKLRIDAEQLSD
ncbi:MAG: SigE family RNA polymerase sigma factor [Actinobacteria bacterium]|nr:SigE family RNA polymerase sigma factor [Actinomycetota bacterium]